MEKIKIISFDIDGTLKNHGEKKIREENIEMLRKLRGNFILVVATGRPLSSIPLELIGKFDYYVVSNGSTIFDKDFREIKKSAFSLKTKELMLEYLSNEEINIGYKNEFFSFYYINNKLLVQDYVHSEETILISDVRPKKDDNIESLYIDITKNQMATLVELCPEIICDHSGFEAGKYIHYEVYCKKAGKFNALKLIARNENLALDDIMAFGDAGNDIELLQNCGEGVLMENARSELHQLVKRNCKSSNEFGILKYLKERKILGV